MSHFLLLLITATGLGAVLALSVLTPASALYRRGMRPVLALGAGLTASALAGWLCFFAFVAGPVAGTAAQIALLAGFIALGWYGREAWASGDMIADVLRPVLISLGAGVIVLLVTFGTLDPEEYFERASNAWSHGLPDDNTLPYLLAEMLRDGVIRSPMNGDWLSSDRPPLQTGMVLLYGPPGLSQGSVLIYQTLSTLVQTFALAGLYMLVRALGGNRAAAWIAVVLLAASPLFIIHSAYVWPKLLPAGLLCVTAALFFTPILQQAGARTGFGALAGLAAALAFGAHGASAFVLAGFALAALALHRFASLRFTFAGLGVFALTYLPWTLYQHFIDPPGNRLLKWHVAGVIPVDDRTLTEALSGSLQEISARDWLVARSENFARIAGEPVNRVLDTWRLVFADDPGAMAGGLRLADFFTWSAGPGIAGPVLFLLPLVLLMRTMRPLASALIAALAVWILVMFEGASTITHQGSFFPQLALIALTAHLAARIDWRLGAALCAVQIVSSGLVYFVFN